MEKHEAKQVIRLIDDLLEGRGVTDNRLRTARSYVNRELVAQLAFEMVDPSERFDDGVVPDCPKDED